MNVARHTNVLAKQPPQLAVKVFVSKISSAFSFYARELNLMSKCGHMNKFYCEIIKIRGKYEKKEEILRVEITDTVRSLHRVLHSSL